MMTTLPASSVTPAAHLSPATPWCAQGTCDWSLKFSITVSTLAGMSCTYRSMTMIDSAASQPAAKQLKDVVPYFERQTIYQADLKGVRPTLHRMGMAHAPGIARRSYLGPGDPGLRGRGT